MTGRPLEENIDYAALNRMASEALLARLTKYHRDPPKRGEPIPPDFDDDDLAPKTMMVRRIQQLVCREFEISMRDLMSFDRVHKHVLARQVGYYISKRKTMLTFPGIGRKFDRDHSTIFHGVRVIAKRIETDRDLAASIDRIEEQLA